MGPVLAVKEVLLCPSLVYMLGEGIWELLSHLPEGKVKGLLVHLQLSCGVWPPVLSTGL